MSMVTAAAPVPRAYPAAAPPAAADPGAPTATSTLGYTVEGGGKSGGGFSLKFDVKKMLLYGAGGAVLGFLLPVIPGGPLGGAAIGAALSLLF